MKYHRDIYLPEQVNNMHFVCALRYTFHALRAAKSDKRGIINLPQVFDSSKATPVDATIQNGRVWRILYRMDYDKDKDLCLVIEPHNRTAVTVWLNDKDDNHPTLDTTRYVDYNAQGGTSE